VRERPLHLLAAAAFASAVPVALLVFLGEEKVYLSGWIHLIGVGVGAAIATAAAIALTVAGARKQDGRAVLVGVAFSVMAAMLLLHGFTTPFVFLEMNGVVALTGGLTLPVGGAIFALSALPAVGRPAAVRPLLWLLGVSIVAIFGLGALAVATPSIIPSVPAPLSPAALALLAAGISFFALLFLRALRTFRLTHRSADLVVAIGIVWLAAALVPSLVMDFWDLGWWLGHGFELVGIALVGGVVAADLYRGSGMSSRPLVGDLRAVELVRREETFLGSHVRALLVALALKDSSTEEHTRRVALRAVEVGEELGLTVGRLRSLALGGLLHDMGKLGVPEAVLCKPGPLSDDEFALVRQHPVDGVKILSDSGGFPAAALRLVRQHHERLDGSGYPDGLQGGQLDLDSRILAVCDVYDALISPRVYREAWSHERALAQLRSEATDRYDARCIEALARVVERELAPDLPAAA
jgi:HD-GYP domain-containing protein (c-di-GMP phosphodiesterase class II)